MCFPSNELPSRPCWAAFLSLTSLGKGLDEPNTSWGHPEVVKATDVFESLVV